MLTLIFGKLTYKFYSFGKSKMGFKKNSKKPNKSNTGKMKNKTGKAGGGKEKAKQFTKKRVHKKEGVSDIAEGHKAGTKRTHSSERNDGGVPKPKKTKS